MDCNVWHTSGSVPMDVLNHHKHYGVLYFPQSFGPRITDFSELPACLEASDEVSMKELEMVAGMLSRKRHYLNSSQRKQLHLAAVYTNNFVNHCYTKAAELLNDQQLDAELLAPLMRETLEKAIENGAFNSQTGPAVRGDQQTIETHLQQLKDIDRDMYRSITQSIIDTHGSKL